METNFVAYAGNFNTIQPIKRKMSIATEYFDKLDPCIQK